MLPVLVPLLRRDGELDLTDAEAALLVRMSAASDRSPAGWRAGEADLAGTVPYQTGHTAEFAHFPVACSRLPASRIELGLVIRG
jgi:hypothetical protein